MVIVSQRKNCLGTMDFTLKMGKMKKAEEFTTYPLQKGDTTEILRLQSGHRWAELNTKTGEVTMSARRAQYADSVWFCLCMIKHTTESDQATEEQLKQILEAVRGTAGDKVGDNCLGMICDNSNAALL